MKSEDKYKKWDLIRQEDERRLREAMLHLHQSENLIQEVLSKLSDDQGRTLVTYEELSGLDYDIWFDVSSGVRLQRKRHPGDNLYFITEMHPEKTIDKRAVFGLQQHDCKEICEVIEGHLIEVLERNKLYTKGDKVFYPSYYMHKPSATQFSVYGVELIKEKIT
jgi:hypothetical protein